MPDNNNNKVYTAAVINLGCKVNKYEADAMVSRLAQSGIRIVDQNDIADFYIVNTCSVTNIAERKSRQLLRRAKRRNPDAVVAAAGCYVNAACKELEAADYVDVVIGNNCKKNIVEILKEYMDSSIDKSAEGYLNISSVKEFEEMGVIDSSYMEHKRAYIKIQDGCNRFCSYCIIPYTRGRVRSRQPLSVLNEIEKLAGEGVKEFVLTGIHIASYGVDFDRDASDICDLGDLICAVSKIKDVKRIRLGSLEPGIINVDFLDRISGVSKLCPHFHLSLQSGCNETLKRMNRKYTIEEFEKKCELLRKYYDRPAITTDVIVGFPGETDEEFHETFDNLKKLELYEIHVFKFSVRSGTLAETMSEQIPENIKNTRSEALLSLTSLQKKKYEESLMGIADEVLIEEECGGDSTTDRCFTGHTTRYVKVCINASNNIINEIIPYKYCKF